MPAHHFGNKAGLLTEFATQGYERLAAVVLEELAASSSSGETDAATMLELIGRGYVRFAVSHPEQFEVMFRLDVLDTDDSWFVEASEAAYALLTATVQRCVGEGRIGQERAEVLAVSAWSPSTAWQPCDSVVDCPSGSKKRTRSR